MPASTPIFLRGHRVAEVRDAVLLRRAKPGERLQRPPAWSFHTCVLEDAKAAGAQIVRVHDLASGLTYEANMGDFDAHGFRVCRGYGEQRALALGRFRILGQEPASEPRREPQPAQLSLFGGAL